MSGKTAVSCMRMRRRAGGILGCTATQQTLAQHGWRCVGSGIGRGGGRLRNWRPFGQAGMKELQPHTSSSKAAGKQRWGGKHDCLQMLPVCFSDGCNLTTLRPSSPCGCCKIFRLQDQPLGSRAVQCECRFSGQPHPALLFCCAQKGGSCPNGDACALAHGVSSCHAPQLALRSRALWSRSQLA